ncbi:GNAT family N-acetyltransferase [Neolewinella sp.]|uniref:GNAT family N-acetyltransferase n=1 Tax=Neolewinella sp. TaxID=2993543 RepID=UPI003B51DFD1
MILSRTTPAHTDYQRLIVALDQDLAVTDGEDHAFYNQFNGSEDIQHVVVGEIDGTPVACGAIKAYDKTTAEVKRMYTVNGARGKGLAGEVLSALEAWACELSYRRLILETGKRQTAAIRLYEKHGYRRLTENYGQYRGVANSVCMEKDLP